MAVTGGSACHYSETSSKNSTIEGNLGMTKNWRIQKNGKEFGPFSSQQIRAFANQKKLTESDLVKRDDETTWSPVSSIKELFPIPETKSPVEGTRSPNPKPLQVPPPVPVVERSKRTETGFFDIVRVLWKLPRKKKLFVTIGMFAILGTVRFYGRDAFSFAKSPNSDSSSSNASTTTGSANSSLTAVESAKKKLLDVSRKMDGDFVDVTLSYVQAVENGHWSWSMADKNFATASLSYETRSAYRQWRAASLAAD